ncbi:uncharacterized protein LOC110933263 [Helianthus annuus]|uniref:uncharacterized protein LOC110933263 n=1 Tax=Helianthus annuus TaxID=4232 RepID=UPI001653173B|nr:uncharacterized protein LOC110933263 [Helianthus annuus]
MKRLDQGETAWREAEAARLQGVAAWKFDEAAWNRHPPLPDYTPLCERKTVGPTHASPWIYGTLSDDLLAKVLQPQSTAHQAWTRIEGIFLNNKGARAATLEEEFTNLTLQSVSSLEAYFQRLKENSDQLAAVDCPVTEKRLVLKLVRGLPTEYDMTGALINQTLPSWSEACDMLLREYNLQKARAAITPPAMAAATMDNPPPQPRPDNRDNRQDSRDNRDSRNRDGSSSRRGQHRGRGGRGG